MLYKYIIKRCSTEITGVSLTSDQTEYVIPTT